MVAKKHPVIRGLLGLCLALIIFFLLVVTLSSFFLGGDSDLTFSDKIGVVPIKGVIIDPETIIDQLHEFRKNRKVKAIVVQIDSPGWRRRNIL